MADVTINQLTSQAPTTSDLFPFSTAVSPSTYKASLAQIKTALAIPTAVSQLTNDSAYITASSLPATQQLAKAWVRFNGPGTSVPANGANVTNLISASYNISSLFYYDRNGWRAYFTAPFANASHLCGTGSSSGNNLAHNLVASVSFTTTYVQFYTPNGGNENVTSRLLPTGQTSFIVYSL